MKKIVRNKKKRNKSRLFFAGVLGASMLSLTSCYISNVPTQFAWFGALFNMDPSAFQLLEDPSRSLGVNIKLDESNNGVELEDVIEPTIRTMNRRLFSVDYYELVNYGDSKYKSFFNESDFMPNTNHGLLTNEKVEELKKDPTVLTLFYKNKNNESDIEGYLPAYVRIKDDWKNKYKEEYYSWFLKKVEEEQNNILSFQDNSAFLSSDDASIGDNIILRADSCEIVDVSKGKNIIPYRLGLNFLDSYGWFKYDESYQNKYLTQGDGQRSVLAKTHYIDLNLSDIINNKMTYDSYSGDLIFTSKENIVINSISFDLEVKTIDQYTEEDRLNDLTKTYHNDFNAVNKISIKSGIYRLDQGDNFYNYAKKFNGNMIAGWMERKEYFRTSMNSYIKEYLFEGQDRSVNFYDNPEDVLNFTFKEGTIYPVKIDYSSALLTHDENIIPKLVINKGENFAIGLLLDDSQLHNIFRITNLNIDFDVFTSYEAPIWYTCPGFSPNTNHLDGINF